ncbi:exopolysaccharide biosynthesis protein [Variovorax sp. KK3]|uniref:exopolysaccharide biosynthesis protein n=1 Tax=Variovorax sp. KK3 TaxID=1855728 RepID=UPI00097BA820|nr:exopolysaccharide biosynthesis protein [Variovorax sp. KK3]
MEDQTHPQPLAGGSAETTDDAHGHSLSDDLASILARAAGDALAIRDIIDVLQGRGFNVFVIFLVLPFCQPVPLPGVSTPFGAVLMLFGLRIALRQEPWLPERLLNYRVPYGVLSRLVTVGASIARRVETFIRPRWRILVTQPGFRSLNGLVVMSSAFVFMLPLPVPLSNAFPAWSILLLALGMMEEDGRAVLAGYAMGIAAWLYIGAQWWLGSAAVGRVLSGA